MITSTALDAYRSHELSISMKTSSGDTLSLNFENNQALSMRQEKSQGKEESTFSFASMQSFSFEFDSNGISDQDQKEIDAFMEKAKPFIENFMKELESNSPINKIASSVTSAIGDLRHKNDDVINKAKSDIVDLFDQGMASIELNQKHLERAQILLEKILYGFDQENKALYA